MPARSLSLPVLASYSELLRSKLVEDQSAGALRKPQPARAHLAALHCRTVTLKCLNAALLPTFSADGRRVLVAEVEPVGRDLEWSQTARPATW